MKVKCGTDIIEINRIKNAIENLGDKFLNTIFTEDEIKYCESHKVQKYQHYAVRFAAKEAAFKALSEYTNDTCDWKSFETLKTETGRPEMQIKFNVDKLCSIDLSLSHCKEYATATVVAILEEGD